MCYDAADADFLFYARVANRTAPVIYDHRRGVRRRFRERRADGDPEDADFVALAKSSQGKKGPVTWSPRVVAAVLADGATPRDEQNSDFCSSAVSESATGR